LANAFPEGDIKVEIGGGNRKLDGWVNLDHHLNNFDIMFDEIPIEDNSVRVFYMSHVIEHIPMCKARECMAKIRKKLKKGGRLRIVCPDLKQMVEAYIRNDPDYFIKAPPTIDKSHAELGIGGMLLNSIISFGSDTYLFDSKEKRNITGIAHICAYDFDMLQKLLSKVGFEKIEKSQYDKNIDPKNNVGQLFVNAFK